MTGGGGVIAGETEGSVAVSGKPTTSSPSIVDRFLTRSTGDERRGASHDEPPPVAREFLRAPGGERELSGASDDAYSAAEGSYVPMLDLVHADGRRMAFAYATLLKAEFDASKAIVLHFAVERVTIEGHRLADLYRAIIQHRAREVIASGERATLFSTNAPTSEPVVTAIRSEPIA